MSNYKSCGNCSSVSCSEKNDPELADAFKKLTGGYIPCNWKKIPCPNCGGILSEIREHNGNLYRHCFSCHFEFNEEESES